MIVCSVNICIILHTQAIRENKTLFTLNDMFSFFIFLLFFYTRYHHLQKSNHYLIIYYYNIQFQAYLKLLVTDARKHLKLENIVKRLKTHCYQIRHFLFAIF